MLLATSLLLFLTPSKAHSWARCVDYKAGISGGDYDEGQCNGWVRGWEFDNIVFGQDRGINFQVGVGSGQDLCGSKQLSGSSSNGYSGSYPTQSKLASYTSGSTVRVVWPAKNHANYECFNFIPDTSMKLFMNPNVNPTSDLSNTASTMEGNGYQLVKDWQEGCDAGSDGCGFQNCPKFCDDTDKATCFGDFVVPDVDQAGYYTFVWYWIFNPGSPYITCFEAYIDPSGSSTTPNNPSPTPRPTTPSPVQQSESEEEETNNNGNTNSNGDGIIVRNSNLNQEWYLNLILDNVDNSCGEEVKDVQILEGSSWRSASHSWFDGSVTRYGWTNQGSKFTAPISVKVITSSKNEITLSGIITTVDSSSEFQGNSGICDASGFPMINYNFENEIGEEYKYQFGWKEFMVLGLVVVNLVVLGMVCCGRRRNGYNVVKVVADTEDEEEVGFVN